MASRPRDDPWRRDYAATSEIVVIQSEQTEVISGRLDEAPMMTKINCCKTYDVRGLRLNVESRGDETLLRAKTTELLALLGGEPG